LDRIARDPTNVVCPVIDTIHDDTFEFFYTDVSSPYVGGFNWNLQVFLQTLNSSTFFPNSNFYQGFECSKKVVILLFLTYFCYKQSWVGLVEKGSLYFCSKQPMHSNKLLFQFDWHYLPETKKAMRSNPTDPLPSPTMAGGLFSIDKKFFEKLGTYDPGFDIWWQSDQFHFTALVPKICLVLLLFVCKTV
jgi:hypothetical protein